MTGFTSYIEFKCLAVYIVFILWDSGRIAQHFICSKPEVLLLVSVQQTQAEDEYMASMPFK